jgi:hypothetical protein
MVLQTSIAYIKVAPQFAKVKVLSFNAKLAGQKVENTHSPHHQ